MSVSNHCTIIAIVNYNDDLYERKKMRVSFSSSPSFPIQSINISFRHFSRRIVFVFGSSILSSADQCAHWRMCAFIFSLLQPTHTSHVVRSEWQIQRMPTYLSVRNLLSANSNGSAGTANATIIFSHFFYVMP